MKFGFSKTSVSPQQSITDHSKAVPLLWFFFVICVVMSINTTTSALLYKHAFMATWLEWWTVVAS